MSFSCICLVNPKHEVNIGGVLRGASCYNASLVIIAGKRNVRHPTDTCKTYRNIPVLRGINSDHVRQMIPFDCVPVAVEFIKNATPLPKYSHPKRAFYIFGAEDATLGSKVLNWCRDTIYIPTSYCMNLAACVNVVLYDRLSKELK